MRVVTNNQKDFPRNIVKHVNAIPPGTLELSDEKQYQFMLLMGEWIYLLGAPLCCKYDSWTKEEFARLLSGMLPANDAEGGFFDQLYWSDRETYPLGPKHSTFALFTIFNDNFKCVKHVMEILSRSPLGDRAAPKMWAAYARAKGLLPHDGYFSDIDNSLLLSLLETSDASVLLSPSDSEPTSQSKLPYPAPWLIIQDAAIAEFFNPRHDPDPKRAQVLAWLESEAKKAGLGKSTKIAEAIFTMIKAKHHDPKNERG